MRTERLRPPLTPPMTISRLVGGRRFYLAAGSPGVPRGTYDRAKAIEFRNFQESRAWTESLDPVWRWALFVAGEYRLDARGSDQSTSPVRRVCSPGGDRATFAPARAGRRESLVGEPA